jgi:hypothetical protein
MTMIDYPKRGGWKERNDRARAIVTQRFLDATQKEADPFEGPIAFPARMAARGFRLMPDNSLSLILRIEEGYVGDVLTELLKAVDVPLAVTLDTIPLPDLDA